MIFIAGLVLILMVAWAVRAARRSAREKTRAEAAAKACAAALSMETAGVAEDSHVLPHRSLPVN